MGGQVSLPESGAGDSGIPGFAHAGSGLGDYWRNHNITHGVGGGMNHSQNVGGSGGSQMDTVVDPPVNSDKAGQLDQQDDRQEPETEVPGGLGPLSAVPLIPSKPDTEDHDDLDEDEMVTCLFSWAHGGHEVYLSGSFHSWNPSDKVQMVKTGHDFVAVLQLPKRRHVYKFVVDDVWKYAPDQETTTDENGFINNVIDITNHRRFRCHIPSDVEEARGLSFNQVMPDPSEYTTDAPAIPQLLSKTPCPASYPPPRLAAPLHGISNHVYHDASAPNTFGPHTSVISVTHRWRDSEESFSCNQKYSTNIFVTMNPLFTMNPACSGYKAVDPSEAFFLEHFQNCHDLSLSTTKKPLPVDRSSGYLSYPQSTELFSSSGEQL